MPTIPRKQTPDPRRKGIKQIKQLPWARVQDPRYNTTKWRRARKAFLSRHPVCAMCMKLASVVDHVQPVTQGGAFWVETNWQPLCASCHSKKTQADRLNK